MRLAGIAFELPDMRFPAAGNWSLPLDKPCHALRKWLVLADTACLLPDTGFAPQGMPSLAAGRRWRE